jgi:hypothetical protein
MAIFSYVWYLAFRNIRYISIKFLVSCVWFLNITIPMYKCLFQIAVLHTKERVGRLLHQWLLQLGLPCDGLHIIRVAVSLCLNLHSHWGLWKQWSRNICLLAANDKYVLWIKLRARNTEIHTRF